MSSRRAIANLATVFVVLSIVEYVEFLFIRTDETFWGDNFGVKLFGLAVLGYLSRRLGCSATALGFRKSGFLRGIGIGLTLGLVTFTIAYGLEFLILLRQGSDVSLEVFVTGFSLTGQVVRQTALGFFALNIGLNIVNVTMEEGIFCGLFQNIAAREYSFTKANLLVAAFFGLWHLVIPIRSYLAGEMLLGTTIAMSVGYVILAALMSIKWGLWRNLTGWIWIGLAEHFFNNTIGNLLHVVTDTGVDELQTLRILIAGLLSFGVALAIWKHRAADSRVSEW